MATRQENSQIRKTAKLMEIIRSGRNMLIVLQDFPDPDAIAAAAALKEMANVLEGIPVSIVCGGIVGRSENRALVKYLGLNIITMANTDFEQFNLIALLDTQPRTGNNCLPPDITPHIVIDHHPARPQTLKTPFHDIRGKYGSTSTILYQHLVNAKVRISVTLATALVYGIRSDTNDLGRESVAADINAFTNLYPAANKRILGKIGMEQVPLEYFCMLRTALNNAKIYGRLVATGLGHMTNPDMTAEVADLLLRHEGSDAALAYGYYHNRILLSLRVSDPALNAGKIMKRLAARTGTGGGHDTMAGAQIPIRGLSDKNIAALEKDLMKKASAIFSDGDATGTQLIPREPSAK